MSKDTFDYEFQAISKDDFCCSLTTRFDKSLLSSFLYKINKRLKKKSIETPDIDSVTKISIPEESFGAIRGLLAKTMNDVKKDVRQDGVTVLSWKIKHIDLHKKNSLDWLIMINVIGYYDKS